MAERSDFSAITTRAAANRLVRQGALVRIHFFPIELGGPKSPHNIGYVPPEAEAARQRAITTIAQRIEQDLIDRLDVSPEYRGDSIVPISITLRAWRDGEEGEIAIKVAVW